MSFFQNYKFKLTGIPLTSILDIDTASVGTEFEKNSGELYVKTAQNVLSKTGRSITSFADVNNQIALHEASVTFHQKNNFSSVVDPTVINDGLQGYSVGSIWINVTTNTVFTCTSNNTGGAIWSSSTISGTALGGGGVLNTYNAVGNGSQILFGVADFGTNFNYVIGGQIEVFISGVYQHSTAFTQTSTNSITFTSPPPNGAAIEVRTITGAGAAINGAAVPVVVPATVTVPAVPGTPAVPGVTTTTFTIPPATGTAGVVQMFGNKAGWGYASGGGSRIYLGQIDAANPTAPFKYLNVDLSEQAHISFDLMLDTIPCGVVFASYLVPMKTNMAKTWTALNNTTLQTQITANPLLADEWGLGYGDAQSVNGISTVEVDIFEASGIGAQTTLHGNNRGVNAATPIDKHGVWSSFHGEYSTAQNTSTFSGVYDPLTFGPGPGYTINTQAQFHVDAVFIGPNDPLNGIADTLQMTVTVTQGAASIVKNVVSVGFAAADLTNLVYTQSIWATDTAVSAVDTTQTSNTWWLDGSGGVSPTTGVTDQRGWARAYNGATPVNYGGTPLAAPANITNPMFFNYNSMSTPAAAAIKVNNVVSSSAIRPVCARTSNIEIDMIDTLGTAITTKVMAWSLDAQYRGIAANNPLSFWSGKHSTSYGLYPGNAPDITTGTALLTSNLIPSMLPGDALAPNFTAYTTGMGLSTAPTVIPSTVSTLVGIFSASVGTTYVENYLRAGATTAATTLPWNIMAADNVGLNAYLQSTVTTAAVPAVAAVPATSIASWSIPTATGTAGVVQMFGNKAGWGYASGGGSRIYLGQIDAANPTAPFKYLNVDLSEQAHISFDLMLDTIPCGVVFASYLVPMKTNMAKTWTALNNTTLQTQITANPLLADEWGLGYGDAQSVNGISTVEVDILEASGIGAQTTLHGNNRGANAATLIDKPGVWSSFHGEYSAAQNTSTFSGVYDPLTFGPGPGYTINTQAQFHVDAVFIGPNDPLNGIADTLQMTVTVTQGAASIVKKVVSVGFAAADLTNLVYTQSIWATDTAVSAVDTTQTSNTWWLDGSGGVSPTTGVTDQRGWARAYNGVTPVNNGGTPILPPANITNHMFFNYNSMSTPAAAAIKVNNVVSSSAIRPVCARTSNIEIDMIDTLGTAITTKVMAWSLDAQYRGIAANNTLSFWSGKHSTSYGLYPGNAPDITTGTALLTSNLIPSMLPGDALAPNFTAYTTGMGVSTAPTVIPSTVSTLVGIFSASVGTTYVENYLRAGATTAATTLPWNIMAADNVGLNAYTNTQIITPAQAGLGNVPNVNLSAAVALNTAKVGITPAQAAQITTNSNKVGITPAQAASIVRNTSMWTDVNLNTAKVGITPVQAAAIVSNSNKVGITPVQAAAIVSNSNKVGITQKQINEITVNTAKVGITDTQAADIISNNSKVSDINHVSVLLPNVNNTSDANKPISIAQNAEFALTLKTAMKGTTNGVASLNANSELIQALSGTATQVALNQLASYKMANGNWNSTAFTLLPDYNLQNWTDELVNNVVYDVNLTVPQNGLAVGWWYVEIFRSSSDTLANQVRTVRVTGTGIGNIAGETWESSNLMGVWTTWNNTNAIPTVWTNAVLTTPWIGNVTYIKDRTTVTIEGSVSLGSNTTTTTIFVLNVGMRPTVALTRLAVLNGGYGRLNILPTGVVEFVGVDAHVGDANAFLSVQATFKTI